MCMLVEGREEDEKKKGGGGGGVAVWQHQHVYTRRLPKNYICKFYTFVLQDRGDGLQRARFGTLVLDGGWTGRQVKKEKLMTLALIVSAGSSVTLRRSSTFTCRGVKGRRTVLQDKVTVAFNCQPRLL